MTRAALRVAVVARSVFPLHGLGGLERHVYDLVRYLADARRRGDADHAPPPRRRRDAPAAIRSPSPRITLRTVPYRTFPFAGPARHDGARSQHRVSALRLARRAASPLELVRAGEIDIVHGFGASVLGYARRRRTRRRRWC